MTRQSYPMLGAAYYPEAWPDSEIPKDIESMKRAGIHVVRIGEFAWHKTEPSEGDYRFDWLRNVIEQLQDAGIRVILGTPSATPPIWLEEKDPEMRLLDDAGLRHDHGGRRHCCSNNPTYRRYCAKIAEKLVQEFGHHPNVIGWQIDNEIAAFDFGCFCPHCVDGFRKHLQRRYGTIENLNARWNLNLFSQVYDSFDQIPQPKPHTWHSPHLKFEWATFHANSHVEFLRLQADILHAHTDRPVGTDMMPVFNQDYEKTNAFLDVIQYNHYDNEDSLWRENFWLDYMRGLKDRPFWVTETCTCWNGSTSTPSDFRREGFCQANSWLPITLGAEANLYWLWRQHWAGHELMHGAVLYASGRPMHIFGEVQKIAAEYNRCSDFLSHTKVKTDIALMVSSTSDYLMKQQEVVWEEGSHQWETAYTKRLYRFYKPVTELGIRADVIPTGKHLAGYRLLFTPFLLTMEEYGLPQRIADWVAQGGIWIVGPMTDLRNDIGAHYIHKETGILEELTGASVCYQVPDTWDRLQCAWEDGTPMSTDTWLQLFDTPEDAQVLATVTNGYSALNGKALIFRKAIGKGWIYALGTLPKEQDLQRLLDSIWEIHGLERFRIQGTIAAARREGNGLQGVTATEYGGNPGVLQIPGRFQDLITEKYYVNEAPLAPFQTVVLQEVPHE